MARPLRIVVPGGLYHLIARGNDRQNVYLDDHDRLGFLTTLEHAIDRFGWLCHAYCLMSNHYHLLIETPQPNLPLGMRQLNGVYAQRFNRRHRRCGHIFQARYRSIFVEKETHPIHAAYRRHGYALREIAEHLHCHYSTISRRLRQQEVALQDLTPTIPVSSNIGDPPVFSI